MKISRSFVDYLNASCFSSAFHPGGHVDRVPPNVVVRFACSNHSCCDRPVIYSKLQHEMIEALLVDAL